MTATRQRLVTALARLEGLHRRNTAQAARLRGGAAKMADHATTFAAEQEAPVLAGDVDAAAARQHALVGRARARELARGDA